MLSISQNQSLLGGIVTQWSVLLRDKYMWLVLGTVRDSWLITKVGLWLFAAIFSIGVEGKAFYVNVYLL